MAMWHAIVTLAIYIAPALVDHCLIVTKTIDEKRNCSRMNQFSLGHFPAINMIYFRSAASTHKFDHESWVVFEFKNYLCKVFV